MQNVLIIESPGLEDITTEDRTGILVAQQLRLIRVPVEIQSIHSSKLLQERLNQFGRDAGVIHIAAHGDKEAIWFTDGSKLTWKELEQNLMVYAMQKIVVISACRSANFTFDKTLSDVLQILSNGQHQPPKCVLTLWGNVFMADVVLCWGLFYRRLFSFHNGGIDKLTARNIYESLSSVKSAGLPKICCAYWYDKYRQYADISPWKSGEMNLPKIESDQQTLPYFPLPH
jgi:hypothetical protein